MANYLGKDLLGKLDTKDSSGKDCNGVFGVAYSILTRETAREGDSWIKMGLKYIEDGHATAFMIDRKKNQFIMTGMGGSKKGRNEDGGKVKTKDKGWVFYGGDLDKDYWARNTESTTTDVYYTVGDDLPRKFHEVRKELKRTDTVYNLGMFNFPGLRRVENCVSSTHYVVYKMDLGWLASAPAKGWWIPSLSNWMTWAASFGTSWKHVRIKNCNTYIDFDKHKMEKDHEYF